LLFAIEAGDLLDSVKYVNVKREDERSEFK